MLVMNCPKCGRKELRNTMLLTGEYTENCWSCGYLVKTDKFKVVEPFIGLMLKLEDAEASFVLREPDRGREELVALRQARADLLDAIYQALREKK